MSHAQFARQTRLRIGSWRLFQVVFAEEEEESEDGRYFLVERQFEFQDGGRCAIETELPEVCGRFRVGRAVLERGRFQISWFGHHKSQAEVTFETDDQSYAEIRRIMGIMIPELEVRMDEKV